MCSRWGGGSCKFVEILGGLWYKEFEYWLFYKGIFSVLIRNVWYVLKSLEFCYIIYVFLMYDFFILDNLLWFGILYLWDVIKMFVF